MFIIFRFLVLNTVEVSDQPFRVILKRVIHFIKRETPPKFSCCSPYQFRMCCTWRCSTCQLINEKEQQIVTVGYRLPLSAIVFKHECKNVDFPIWKLLVSLNLRLESVKSFKILFLALFFFNTDSNFALRM